MSEPTHIHHSCQPGLTMQGVTFKQVENHGLPCWIATAKIGSVFGQVVEGECTGIGRTQEQALERLKDEQKKLYNSLWD